MGLVFEATCCPAPWSCLGEGVGVSFSQNGKAVESGCKETDKDSRANRESLSLFNHWIGMSLTLQHQLTRIIPQRVRKAPYSRTGCFMKIRFWPDQAGIYVISQRAL